MDTRKWTLPVPFISRCQMIVFAEKVEAFSYNKSSALCYQLMKGLLLPINK